ncbi:hypothetical protein TELCIR_12510 [Teladorsagia circumcincta]|uniref:Amino acid permease/ SLC12A domain-containing protein n=1 Tax=Teladorsagia circumcincta TaxID=45464 RepID=A0A2G9U8G7_TELCI|nr:hypothetical protein TELCIR_12510 [Teladorsagia circumcincta]
MGATFSGHGISRFSYARLRENADPMYARVNCTPVGFDRTIPEQSFFTVFGVFFANFLGVLAGVNMSGDLKDPHKSIPLGELSAVGVSSSICFLFIMILGATGDRLSLICDNLISEKVALTGVLFMIGLYICSLSSTIGSLLGTPRVLQGIAAEGIIPVLNPLAQGSGANKNPVLAGVNMSGDLKDPHKSIPLGELSAVGVSSSICFLFIMILGATGDRLSLICDNLISEKVALTGVLFMIGLYICSLSSTIGSLLGTPRVLQGIAAEGIIPVLNPLAQGSGANKNPVLAGVVLMAVASVFVLLGDLNQLAILSTMPFLITYAFVNYSYVSLAMSYDLITISHVAEGDSKYGSMQKIGDLDELFPERQQQQQQCAATVEAGGIVGISTFSIPHMFRTAFSSLETIGVFNRGPSVLTREGPSKDVLTEQLNESNPDYQDRKQYHHAQNVTQEFD